MFKPSPKKTHLTIISTLVVLIVVFFVYGTFSEIRAEKKAKEFCANIKVGSSTDGLIDNALRAGAVKRYLQWRNMTNGHPKQSLMVMFVGATPFSRHFCDVEAVDQRAVNAQYSYLGRVNTNVEPQR